MSDSYNYIDPDYTYTDPDSGILRNLQNIKDPEVLIRFFGRRNEVIVTVQWKS